MLVAHRACLVCYPARGLFPHRAGVARSSAKVAAVEERTRTARLVGFVTVRVRFVARSVTALDSLIDLEAYVAHYTHRNAGRVARGSENV